MLYSCQALSDTTYVNSALLLRATEGMHFASRAAHGQVEDLQKIEQDSQPQQSKHLISTKVSV
jgi:hypothetical protein